MICCALCGRKGERGYETMAVVELCGPRGEPLEARVGWLGGELVQLPGSAIAAVWVCSARASCRRRRGLRP